MAARSSVGMRAKRLESTSADSLMLTLHIGQQTNSYYGGSNTPPATSNPSLKAFHVPRPQNVCFSARASEIDRMHEILCPEHGTSTEKRQETCLLYGTSGMGKTQAALEFAYKHRSCYDLVYWVHCETESAYLTDMLEIAQSLRLKLGDKAKDDAIAKAVRSWFGNTGWCLFACWAFLL